MLKYKEQDIRYLASTSAVFDRGYALYADHHIESIQFIKREHYFFSYELRCTMKGSFDYYDTNAVINNQGLVTKTYCDCQAYSKYPGCCKHLVALLLTAKRLEEDGDVVWENEATIRMQKQAQDILFYFKEQTEKQFRVDNLERDIDLLPKLKLSQGRLEVDVMIGKTRKYVVKDLMLFSKLVKENQTYAYGLELEFVHDKKVFSEQSQPFLSFILNGVADFTSKNGMHMKSVKSLPLLNHQTEMFFKMFEAQAITVQIGTLKNKLLFLTDERLPLTFRLSQEEEEVIVSNELNVVHIHETESATYVFTSQKIYRVIDEQVIQALRLMKMLEEKGTDLRLQPANMNAFISYVVPQIEPFVDKVAIAEIFDKYEVYPLHVKMYLDIDEKQALIATVYLTYKDTQFLLTDEEIYVDVVRDRLKEATLSKQMSEYGFKFRGDAFSILDENEIYEFMRTGLAVMANNYEVHGSDAFKTLKITKPKALSVSVRLDQNLMAFSFSDLPFDLNEYAEVLAKYKLKKKYHRLRDGSFLDLKSSYMDSMFELVSALNLDEADLMQDEIQLAKYRALYLDKILDKHHIKVKRNDAYETFVTEFKSFDEQAYVIPTQLEATLRPYQETGYRWLKMLSDYGLGGVLADDMGLGKTIQIIALLASSNMPDKPSIIVTPSSLIYNWASELERFAPHLKFLIVSGTQLQRKELIHQIESDTIVITSYDMMRRDQELYHMSFKYAIIDEAHYIKNQQTQNAKAVKKLNSEIRFALTGTPLENSIADLWSIFDFILPGYLLSYPQFKQMYEVQIVKHENEQLMSRVKQLVAPFILRRLKRDVLSELPDKIESIVYCELVGEQKKIYDATLLKINKEIQADVESVGLNQTRIKMLAMLTRLRQLCCDPSLYIDNYEHESAKLELCLEIIQESIEGGHRILLFSQFTSMLEIIANQLTQRNIDFYQLTGQTPAKERLKLTNLFNEGDTPIFLISLKAGGTGLNLTGADVVIHYDPWWNMSAENQATDRAHRMGQTNKVQVFKLITKNTIEEKIEKLQQKKLELSESLVQEGEQFMTHLTATEIQDLFNR